VSTFTQADVVESLTQWLSTELDLEPCNGIQEGKICYCRAKGKNKPNRDGRVRAFFNNRPAAWAENHYNGSGVRKWAFGRDEDFSPAEREASRVAIEAARREREAEDERIKTAASELSKRVWDDSAPCDEHPYQTAKGVQSYGLRKTTREWRLPCRDGETFLTIPPGALVVPGRDVHSQILTLQFIETDGTKLFLPGGQKKGSFFFIGEPAGVICIVEGYATGATVHAATGHAVAVAFDCGNLQPVAEALRAEFPDAKLVVCPDDDHHRENNPGLTCGTKAAKAVGALFCPPDLGPAKQTGGTDFNDWAQALGPGGLDVIKMHIENALAQATATTEMAAESVTAADNWPSLQPLVTDLAPEPYPINAHPSLSREAIEEVQGFVQAPVALVAQSALGAQSVTVQALCDVQRPSMPPSPTSLFLVALGLSGERKTSCDGHFRDPIDDFEHAANENAKPALADYAADLATWEACKRAIASRIEKAKKNHEPIDTDTREMREHQAALPKAPRVPVLLIQDSTSEALISQLSAWPSAAIAASEGGMVFGAHAMSAETIMRTLSLYDSAWDGKPLRVLRRKENGSVFLSSARLTLNVQIQPRVFLDFLSSDRGLSRDIGFLARVLWSCPETTQGQRMFKHAPKHWPALARFNARTAELLNQRPRIDADGALTLDALPLSPAAEVAWIAYHDAVERRLRVGGDLCDIRDVASKAADNAARMAAIFDVYASRKTAITAKTAVAEPIDEESMGAAIRVVEWHLLEARRFLGSLSLPTEYVDASLLEEWLRSYCKGNSCKSVSLSTIQKYGPGRLRSKDVLTGVLKTLSDLGRAREIPGEGKARLVEVAPSLLATAVIAVPAVIQPTTAPGMDDAFEPAEDTHCGDGEGEVR
jgi:putative DNA primase/helicase